MSNLSNDEWLYWYRQLKSVRVAAINDSENWQDLLAVIERLGRALPKSDSSKSPGGDKSNKSLGDYRDKFEDKLGLDNNLVLYDAVRNARNEAAHIGFQARHLAKNAVRLTMVLEQKIMELHLKKKTAQFLMSDLPFIAQEWHTLEMIRNEMAMNGYSKVPYKHPSNASGRYYWITDEMVAKAWATDKNRQRKIPDLQGAFSFTDTHQCENCKEGDTVEPGYHLVLRDNHPVGVITPFDFL